MGIVAAVVCIGLNCLPANVSVYDGDTFTVAGTRYRISGIDAPEIEGDCVTEKVYARTARNRLEELLQYKTVSLKIIGRDRYKRSLTIVTVDGQDVGDVILREGLARKWTKKWDHRQEPWCAF